MSTNERRDIHDEEIDNDNDNKDDDQNRTYIDGAAQSESKQLQHSEQHITTTNSDNSANHNTNANNNNNNNNNKIIIQSPDGDGGDNDNDIADATEKTKQRLSPISRRLRTRSSRRDKPTSVNKVESNRDKVIIRSKDSIRKRTARKSVMYYANNKKQSTTTTTSRTNDRFESNYDDDDNDSTTDGFEYHYDSNEKLQTSQQHQHIISDTIRNEIYWSIQTQINVITGALVPVPGELDRVGRLYNVNPSFVQQIWCQGQESILRQIVALTTATAPSAASNNSPNDRIPPSFHNTADGMVITTGTVAAAAAALNIQPDVSIRNDIDNDKCRKPSYPDYPPYPKVQHVNNKNSKNRRDFERSSDDEEEDYESENEDSISDASIESISINSALRRKRRVRLQSVPNFTKVKEMIENLNNANNDDDANKSMTQSEIAAAINISKQQLVRFIRAYPEIDTFWNLIRHHPSKTTTTPSDSGNSDDDEHSVAHTKRRRRHRKVGNNRTTNEVNRKRASTRKRKIIHHATDTSDSEPSEVRKKRKSKKIATKDKPVPKQEKIRKTKKGKKEVADGKSGDEVEDDDNYQSAISDADTNERRTRKRKGNTDIKVSDKEAIWIALQSNYDTKEKDIRRGHMARVAKQFNVSSSSVSRIWLHGKASMKQQLQELEAAAAAGDQDAAAALAAGGPIIRPDFNNKRINCGQKPKYDLNKVNEMLESIPVSERKSINQTAKLLGMTSNTLWRLVNKYNPRPKPSAPTEIEIKIQLRQQKKLANKVRSGIRNERLKKEKKRKSTATNTHTTNTNDINGDTDHNNTNNSRTFDEDYSNNNNNNNNEADGVDRTTDTTIAPGLLAQEQAVLAAIRQPWIPATNESYWY